VPPKRCQALASESPRSYLRYSVLSGYVMSKASTRALSDLNAYRKSRGENQSDFWLRFGVTQSGGSRYESGRALPKPVAVLLIAFVDGLLDDTALRRLVKAANKLNVET